MQKISQQYFLEDSVIRETLYCDVILPQKEWARKYMLRDFDAGNVEYNSIELRHEFKRMARENVTLEELLRQYPLNILVNALLAHYITENVFKRPFLPLDEVVETNISEGLMKLYHVSLKGM